MAGALEGLARSSARAITLSQAARARVEQDFDASRSAGALMREMGLRPFDEIEDDLPPVPVPSLTASSLAGPGRWRAS